jgi:hypothetical protein
MYKEISVKLVSLLSVLLLCFSSNTFAEKEVSISTGFVSGNTFRALDAVSKNVYATGIIDGVLIAPLYGAPKNKLAVIEKCTVGMTGQQLVAIFDKYLNSNPEVWNKSMHTIVFLAMSDACKIYT